MKQVLRFAAVAAFALCAQAADFSYYVLALSYAPEFCGHSAKRDARECGPTRPAFVVHGLWPQNESGRGPERCGPARPVAADLVRRMLSYFPTEGLVQHEWETHGTCTGLTPAAYFAAVQRTRDSIRIPTELEELRQPAIMPPMDVEGLFQRYNPGIPRNGFRTACYADSGLQEIRVCFDRNWIARACTGAPECTKGAVRLSPSRRAQ
jgi:ribonuclease T2